jgi:hypothetical protein
MPFAEIKATTAKVGLFTKIQKYVHLLPHPESLTMSP